MAILTTPLLSVPGGGVYAAAGVGGPGTYTPNSPSFVSGYTGGFYGASFPVGNTFDFGAGGVPIQRLMVMVPMVPPVPVPL